MLTKEGCQARRQRLLQALHIHGPLLLSDPVHLRYFAGCHIDPFSLGADYTAYLRIQPDGRSTLIHDHRLPKSVDLAHVDERLPVKWYDGLSPGQGPRRLIVRDMLDVAGTGGRIHDAINDPIATRLYAVVQELRRRKDADEVEVLRACMRATEAGQAWARAHVQAGMTELDVYCGIAQACSLAAGQPVLVYGDFAVSPGPSRRGGMPTTRPIQAGETLILDFSVVLLGYRSDFTNTLVVGAEPTPEQQRMFDFCRAALAEGERRLKAGAACRDVYNAVRAVFASANLQDAFPHHAGHGLGVAHPEPPYIVREATETLVPGDVITLEPGLYLDGVGGIRIEHNYLITASGFERLSHHELTLR